MIVVAFLDAPRCRILIESPMGLGTVSWLPNSSTSKNLFTPFLVHFARPARKRRADRVRLQPT